MPKGIYERTAYHRKRNSEGHKRIHLSPEHCTAISDAKKGVPNSPEHNAAISKGLKGVPKLPKTKAAMSRAHDTMRGGNDIVNHHYLYDHSDLSLNIIGITRSDHMRLHKLLQKLKYIVPHINVKEI